MLAKAFGQYLINRLNRPISSLIRRCYNIIDFYHNTTPDDEYCIIFETLYVYEILLSGLVNR